MLVTSGLLYAIVPEGPPMPCGCYCPARGYCVEQLKKTRVRASVRASILPLRNRHGPPIGTTFWNVCEGTVKFGGPKTDPFWSRRENGRVSVIF